MLNMLKRFFSGKPKKRKETNRIDVSEIVKLLEENGFPSTDNYALVFPDNLFITNFGYQGRGLWTWALEARSKHIDRTIMGYQMILDKSRHSVDIVEIASHNDNHCCGACAIKPIAPNDNPGYIATILP